VGKINKFDPFNPPPSEEELKKRKSFDPMAPIDRRESFDPMAPTDSRPAPPMEPRKAKIEPLPSTPAEKRTSAGRESPQVRTHKEGVDFSPKKGDSQRPNEPFVFDARRKKTPEPTGNWDDPLSNYQLDPVNPLSSYDAAGKWFWRSIHNMTAPVKNAWASRSESSWAIPLTALEAFNLPFNAPASMITAAAGFDETASLYEAAYKYTNSRGWAAPARWVTEAAGFAADIKLQNKFSRAVSFGPRHLTRDALSILEKHPTLAGASPERQMEARRFATLADELTPENIRHIVVPNMVADTLKVREPKGSHIVQEFPQAAKTYTDPNLMQYINPALDKSSVKIFYNPKTRRNQSFEEIRDEFLQLPISELKKHSKINLDLFDSVSPAPLSDKIRNIAAYAAYVEKEALDGLPYIRLHVGHDFSNWENYRDSRERGIKIAPSPIPAIGTAFRSIFFESVRDTPELRAPLETIVDPALLDQVNSFVNATIGYVSPTNNNRRAIFGASSLGNSPVDVGKLNAIQFEHLISMIQKDPIFDNITEITGSKVLVDEAKLQKFVLDEIGAITGKNNRRLHLENLMTTLSVFSKVMHHLPHGYFATEATKLDTAITRMRAMLDPQNLIKYAHTGTNQGSVSDIYHYLNTTHGDIMHTQRKAGFRLDRAFEDVRNITSEASSKLRTATADIEHLVNQISDPRISAQQKKEWTIELFELMLEAKGGSVKRENQEKARLLAQGYTPDQISKILGKDKMQRQLSGGLTRMLLAFEDMMRSTVSYPVAAAHRRLENNIIEQLKDITKNYASLQKTINDAFETKNIENLDGIRVLKNLLEDDQFRDFFTSSSRNNYYTTQSTVVQTPAPGGSYQARYNTYTPNRNVQNLNILTQVNQRIRAQFKTNIAQKVTNMEITPAQATELNNFIDSLPEWRFKKLIETMADISEANLQGSLKTALMDRIGYQYKYAIDKANEIVLNEHTKELSRLQTSFSQFQTIRNPKEALKFLFKPGGVYDTIDQLGDIVFRRVGLNYGALEVVQDLEKSRANLDPACIEYGIELNGELLNKAALKANPTLEAKLTVTRELQEDLVKFSGKFAHYFHTAAGDNIGLIGQMPLKDIIALSSSQRKNSLPSSIKRDLRVFSIAESEALDAITGLEKVFGSEKAVNEFVADWLGGLEKDSIHQFGLSWESGLMPMYRKNWHPYDLVGDKKDIEAFKQYLIKRNLEDMDVGIDEVYTGTGPGASNQISRGFSGEKNRTLQDAAGVMHEIEKCNAERIAQGEEALNIRVDDDVIASRASAKKKQLTAILNRKALSNLLLYLPNNSVIRKPSTEDLRRQLETLKDANGATAWHNLGGPNGLIPALEGHYISGDVYRYLKQYFPNYQIRNGVMQVISDYWNFVQKLTVQFNLIHLKNIFGLAYIAGVNPVGFFNTIYDATKEASKYEARHPGIMNYMTRVAQALEDSATHRMAVRSGLTHFRGSAQFRSVAENVKLGRNPFWSAGRIWDKGIASTLVFDVLDRGVKITLFDQLLKQGIPPNMAANWVNYFLIDYSARNLNPNAKSFGYAAFPFFSWKVQNMLLHIPNMIQNPSKYVMAQFMRNYVTDNMLDTKEYDREHLPEALAKTMPIPYSFDNRGNQSRVMIDFPWDQWVHLFQTTAGKNLNPLSWRADLYRYFLVRSRLSQEFREAMNPYQMKKVREETLWESMISPQTSWLTSDLWSLDKPAAQLLRLGKSVLDPYRWKDVGPAFLDFSAQFTLGDVSNYTYNGNLVKPYPTGEDPYKLRRREWAY